jgi:23S rRNA pseudouridine1911/1915/1917 synthase
MTPRIDHLVTSDQAGLRLDRLLASFEGVGSRAAAVRLIESGAVAVDGEAVRKSHQVSPGERIVVEEVVREAPGATSAAKDVSIVFEDEHLLVVDKPAGMVVHPAPGNYSGTLSQALASRAAGGAPERPGIVHRLDKETSGLLVVAKSDQVLRKLQAALQERKIARSYTALVRGRPESPAGTIDAPLGRDRREPEKISIRADSERPAITHFETVEELAGRTLLSVRLETGRTHQIRVHLAAVGLPVCGDPQYGVEGDLGLKRQFLHASGLSFTHPVTGEQLELFSPLPEDLASALQRAREDR